MVQQTLDTPDQLMHFQLRTALTMEHDSLAAVEELAYVDLDEIASIDGFDEDTAQRHQETLPSSRR